MVTWQKYLLAFEHIQMLSKQWQMYLLLHITANKINCGKDKDSFLNNKL